MQKEEGWPLSREARSTPAPWSHLPLRAGPCVEHVRPSQPRSKIKRRRPPRPALSPLFCLNFASRHLPLSLVALFIIYDCRSATEHRTTP
ncbi:hypothetical protein SKAU_G00415980 [Synaphobranchus kaupii]|uniref:Uncharacterized protein n=1 Tax=Synaphobranchus kaupii TaxID=118154 RepID=A0A9Q1E7E2_SYNKA|nr:hypothetical protein SKAU_G00415980 [Synaphobranchus kaupii]